MNIDTVSIWISISVDRRLVVTLYLELLVTWLTKEQLHPSQQSHLARHTHSMDHFPLLQSMLLAGDQRPLLKVTNKQIIIISGCYHCRETRNRIEMRLKQTRVTTTSMMSNSLSLSSIVITAEDGSRSTSGSVVVRFTEKIFVSSAIESFRININMQGGTPAVPGVIVSRSLVN